MSVGSTSLSKGEGSISITQVLFKIIALGLIDVFAVLIIYRLVAFGGTGTFVATAIGIITIFINIVFWRDDLYHWRWFSPGLSLMVLMVLYPVIYTVMVAFTNNGTGHLLDKEQAIEQLEKVRYVPETGSSFPWTNYLSDDGESFLIWISTEDGGGQLLDIGAVLDPATLNVTDFDADGIPNAIPGYTRLKRGENLKYLSKLSDVEYGLPPYDVSIKNMDEAAPLKPRYVYDAEQDVMVDQSDGTIYYPVEGTFTSEEGATLTPGFYVFIGFSNFSRLFSSPAFRGPFVQIFIWTFVFAFMSVFTTFALGLFFAIMYNDPSMKGRKMIRSLLLIPYAIPAFISVQMWRGLLNPSYGVVSGWIEALVGVSIPWFSDPFWAKVGIILVNLWLGYPYMMLVTTGALQAIPSDLYEAADVDGANILRKFWNITLPLLLVAVGPLLIGSFAFNFNNFTVIDVYNQGGPPIPNSPTQAGATDILISYTYRLAFASGRGVDYGYASAITIIIFIVLSIITAMQFRYTNVLEEVSENV